MKVRIKPGQVSGNIRMVTSKSIAHRYFICAALSRGVTVVDNIDLNDDLSATLSAIETLGAKTTIHNNQVIIEGIKNVPTSATIDCKESASTLRFLIPLCAALNVKTTFIGSHKLLSRPQTIYKKIALEDNLNWMFTDDKIIINDSLVSRDYYIDGSISSQFFTGLFFALSLLKNDSRIHFNNLESKSYIDLTIDSLERFGVKVISNDEQYIIRGNQQYIACNVTNEIDYSQFAFFGVLAATNSKLTFQHQLSESLQADYKIFEILNMFGSIIEEKRDCFTVSKGTGNSFIFNVSDCPDLFPIIVVLATFTKKSMISGLKRLAYKESNRLLAMIDALNKLNIKYTLDNEVITIYKNTHLSNEVELNGYNDHRIVMALSILATTLKHPVTINDATAINKSFVSFFELLENSQVDIEYIY